MWLQTTPRQDNIKNIPSHYISFQFLKHISSSNFHNVYLIINIHIFMLILFCFGLLLVYLCRFFFEKEPRPKWTIYKHVSDKSKKCLSLVILKFCLSSVAVVIVHVLAPAYTSLSRSLDYLSKVRYNIVIDPLRDGFFNFRDRFSGQVGNTALCLKNNITKISGICVWQHIFSPNFHRMYV